MIYRYNSTPIKIPASYFVDIGQWILEFIWKQKTKKSQHMLDGEAAWGGLTLPDLKIYWKASSHNGVMGKRTDK